MGSWDITTSRVISSEPNHLRKAHEHQPRTATRSDPLELRVTIRLKERSIHEPMHYETTIRTRGSHELEERDPTRVGYSDPNRGEEHDPKQRERGPR